MGYILKASCSNCKNQSGELLFDARKHPCFCHNCQTIVEAKGKDFTFSLENCDTCNNQLFRRDIVSMKRRVKCPWCNKFKLQWEEIMHVQLSYVDNTSIPSVGEVVHGRINRSGKNGKIVRVNIENLMTFHARPVPRNIDIPDKTHVECTVINIDKQMINLKINRIVIPSDY